MNDDTETSSIYNMNRTTNSVPLFTCALKFDKYDYEKKVSDPRRFVFFILFYSNRMTS